MKAHSSLKMRETKKKFEHKKKRNKEIMVVDMNSNKKDEKKIAEEVHKVEDASLADARNQMIKDFNEKYSNYAVLSVNDDAEYKAQAKKDFEDYTSSVQNKSYEIANKEHSVEVAKFLQQWNAEYNHWEAQAWKGVIYFDKIISAKLDELESGKAETLVFDYGTLSFIYGSMMKPQGVGLKSAEMMEVLETPLDENKKPIDTSVGSDVDIDNVITYSTILEKLGRHIDFLKMANNKIQILQQRWALAESGIKMDLKITELEEFKKFVDDINNSGKTQG